MPSIPQRGFIVRPTQDNTEPEAEPECESVNIQACRDPYSFFTSDEVVPTSRWGVATSWNIPEPNDAYSSRSLRSVEDRIKNKMLEKIEEFLESNQLNELSVLVTDYQKFKELHP